MNNKIKTKQIDPSIGKENIKYQNDGSSTKWLNITYRGSQITHEKAKATRAQITTVASKMFHKSLQ